MAKHGRAATADEIAESRSTLHDLEVMWRKTGIKVTGLSIALAVMVAGTLLGGLMMGGYVQPPALKPEEARQLGTVLLCFCGAGAGYAFYLLFVFWGVKVQVGMSRDRLQNAIENEVAGQG